MITAGRRMLRLSKLERKSLILTLVLTVLGILQILISALLPAG
jgi:hypothetical protein